ncbi:MAG: hypothetical protein RIB67_00780 [Miltoncostaeaceae bacterium]
MSPSAPAWEMVLRDPDGRELATVTVAGTDITVEPPEATDDPFVAAALAEVRRTVTRPRARPACARDPSVHTPR